MITSNTYLLIERNKKARETHEEVMKKSNKSYIKELEQKLDEKDWEILKHIHKMKLANSEQIQKLVYGNTKYGNRYTNNKLLKLFKLGCIDRCFPATPGKGGAEQIVVLTRIGAKLLKLEKFTPIKRLNQKWKHIIAVNDLYVHFKSKYEKIAFNPELKIKWEKYEKGTVKMKEIRADALIQWSKKKIALFEVDLGTETQQALNKKIDAYHEYYTDDALRKAPWQHLFERPVLLPVVFVLNDEKRMQKLMGYYKKFVEKHNSPLKCYFVLFDNLSETF